MKILIVGKLTDLPEGEKNSYFHDAIHLLWKFSWDPVNPLELLKDESLPFGKIIERIENLMHQCEAIFMMKNWRDCAGATVLHSLAKHYNKPVYYEEWHTTTFMKKFHDRIKSRKISA